MKLHTHAGLLALLLAGINACSRAPSPDQLYRRAELLLHDGNLDQARLLAEAGYRTEPSWRFRLLEIDILRQVNPREALARIADAGDPGSPELRARLDMDRGWANYLISNYSVAEASLNRARDLAANLQIPDLTAQIELELGTVLAQKGDLASAEEDLRGALDKTERGDRYLRIRALGTLGWFFLFTHRPDQAIYWLDKQRDDALRIGAERQVAYALGNLGSAYYRLGDFDHALPLLKEAEHRFDQLGDRRAQQGWLGNIGNVLLDQDEYADAIPIYTRAAAIAREISDPYWTAWWENNLAIAYRHLGDYDQAERHNNEALRLKRSIHSADFYPLVNEAGIAAARKNFTGAEVIYRTILSAPSTDPVPQLQAESGLAKLLGQIGQIARADAEFRSGIELVERSRAGLTRDEYKLSYLSSLIEFYQRYVDFLVDRGQAGHAAEIVESSRAQLLDERLNASHKSSPSLTVSSFRQLARASHSVILSYWLAPDRSFLWVITPDAVTLHVLPPEKQIATLVENYRTFIEALRDPLQSEFADGRKLSEILLGPVRPLLRDGSRLLIVPDRALNSLNFETLPDPSDASHYLIERATVSVAPSLGVLALRRAPPKSGRRILLIGDPDTAVEEYPKLPYASREMEMIGRNFTSDRLTRIDGARAFPSAYRSAGPAQFSLIHFAAHASANRENPLDSALILSRHDGVYALSARDVMEIPLHADLVTISACRGAGAKTYSGEGLVGLSWAFLRAGARNVVAGLWDVTDLSTATLMADFYAGMTKNLPPADALRAAKLRLLHSTGAYRKPFYWAPFQLYAASVPTG